MSDEERGAARAQRTHHGVDGPDPAAFEVSAPGVHYRIWSDGRIEGFPSGAIIMNRIPALIAASAASSALLKGEGSSDGAA